MIQKVKSYRHTGRECRYPVDRDVSWPAILGLWVPAIHAGTTATLALLSKLLVFQVTALVLGGATSAIANNAQRSLQEELLTEPRGIANLNTSTPSPDLMVWFASQEPVNETRTPAHAETEAGRSDTQTTPRDTREAVMPAQKNRQEELLTELHGMEDRGANEPSPDLIAWLASQEPVGEARNPVQAGVQAITQAISHYIREAVTLAQRSLQDEPLSQPEMHTLAGRGESAPAAGSEQVNNKTNNNQETIGEKPQEATAERVFLRDQAVLLKAGQSTLELDLLYTKSDQQQGFLQLGTIIQTINAGSAQVPQAQIDQDTFISNFSLRHGLLDNLQAFTSIPLTHQSTTTSIAQETPTGIGVTDLSDTDRTEWGDLTLGMRYAALKEGMGYPSVILSADGQIPTQDSPSSIGGSVALTKSQDPAILFANIGIRHSFNDDVDFRLLKPDNSINATLGVAYALNDTLTLSTSVLGVFDLPTSAENIALPSGKRGEVKLLSDEHYFLRLGLTAFLIDGLYVEPNVSFNISDPGSTATFGVNLPYTFSL